MNSKTVLFFLITLSSCKKLLQELPSSDMSTPTTFQNLEALFNDRKTMNSTPGLNDLSADNLYLLPGFWQQFNPIQQNAYLWLADIYGNDTAATDYDLCSAQVRNSNLVIDGLNKIPISDNPWRWNTLMGQALFFRAAAFYNMAQLYAKPYDPASAASEPGIPLRLNTSIKERSVRASILETYRRIIVDLRTAVPLLSSLDAADKWRPSKPAVYAQLARVYQSMRIYDSAALYVDSSLKLYNALVDYNTLDLSVKKPFGPENAEIIFEASASEKTDALQTTFAWGCIADSDLVKMYKTNDLRAAAFYSPFDFTSFNFKRGYSGNAAPFTGLATDELYLIRAESRARAGNIDGAMSDLDTLLKKRWKQGAYVRDTASTVQEALEMILRERRKELPLRGVRWTDLRRLNMEGFGIIPKRYLNGALHTLPPGDQRYVLPFPKDVIQLTGMQQNPR